MKYLYEVENHEKENASSVDCHNNIADRLLGTGRECCTGDNSNRGGYADRRFDPGTESDLNGNTTPNTAPQQQVCPQVRLRHLHRVQPRPPHIHAYEEVETIEPSCFEAGSITVVCVGCLDEITEIIPEIGEHSWDSGTIIRYANCGESGELLFVCDVCGETRSEKLPKTKEHVWDEGEVIYPASCARKGEVEYTCLVCHESEYDTIPKTTEHAWNSGTVTVNPTKDSEGLYTYTCYECGETKSETIEPSSFDASAYGNPYYFRISNNPDNSIELSINGNVAGTIR